MNKIFSKYKTFFWFLLLLIPVIFLVYNNKDCDNDLWFLLATGKDIVKNGIPYIDRLSLHSGLKIVTQQWLTSLLFSFLFTKFGKYGMLSLVLIIFLLAEYLFYRLCYLVSNNKYYAIIGTVFSFSFLSYYFVTRPQIITYLFLIIELLQLEKYIRDGNNKHLYILPILSILLINLHASMWAMLFIFMLPFIMNAFRIKKINKDKYKLKPLLIVSVIMLICGFINPYGIGAMTFLLKGYGSETINNLVSEMNPFSYSFNTLKVAIIPLFIMLLSVLYVPKFKIDTRHFLFFCGTLLLAFMHKKGLPYFILTFYYVMCYGFRNVNFDIKLNNIKIIFNSLLIACSLAITFTSIYAVGLWYKYCNFNNIFEGTFDYMDEHFNKDDIVLYMDYNNGGYGEYRGYKPYLDPRAEVFIKKFNKKEEILDEFVNIFSYTDDEEELEEAINKYGFTHFVVLYKSFLREYLEGNSKYIKAYIQYYNDSIDGKSEIGYLFIDSEKVKTYEK